MQILGLIMDGLLLLFLAGTMVFVFRLSKNIKAFRQSRGELDKLVKDLGSHIEKADRAITGLKNSAKDAGKDLQSLIDQSRALSDELQMMTESGDNLAGRLERLAERNRDIADRIEKAGGKTPSGLSTREPAMKRMQEEKRVPTGPSFAIRDREVENKEEVSVFEDDEFSKAERELMAALRMGKK
jgi:chromosome segregation ATPase